MKFLIVEDDAASQIFLKTLTRKFADNVLIADNGIEAIEVINKLI